MFGEEDSPPMFILFVIILAIILTLVCALSLVTSVMWLGYSSQTAGFIAPLGLMGML